MPYSYLDTYLHDALLFYVAEVMEVNLALENLRVAIWIAREEICTNREFSLNFQSFVLKKILNAPLTKDHSPNKMTFSCFFIDRLLKGNSVCRKP